MYLEQQQYLKMIALEYIGCVKYAHLHLFQKLKVLLHLSTTKLSVATLIQCADRGQFTKNSKKPTQRRPPFSIITNLKPT